MRHRRRPVTVVPAGIVELAAVQLAGVQVEAGRDFPAPGLAGTGLHVAAVGVDPLLHADQAAADARGGRRGAARAVIVDVDAQLAGQVLQPHRGPGARAAVLEGVGQGLLHQPVHGELHPRGHVRGGPVDLQRGVQPGRPDLVDEQIELGQVRDRLEALAGVLAGPLAQHAEQPAGIGQGPAPGGRHRAHDLGGPLRGGGRRRDRRVAQGDHDREVMGDDVVHLPGDPGPLGGRGEGPLLIPLAFQAFRAVAQFGQVGPAGGRVQAEPEGGRDHAGNEDRVEPPAAAREQQQPDDHPQLEQARAHERVPAWPQRGHGVQGDEQGRAVDGVGPETDAGVQGQHHGEYRDRPDPADHERRGRQGQQQEDGRHVPAGVVVDGGWACRRDGHQGDQHVEYPAGR